MNTTLLRRLGRAEAALSEGLARSESSLLGLMTDAELDELIEILAGHGVEYVAELPQQAADRCGRIWMQVCARRVS